MRLAHGKSQPSRVRVDGESEKPNVKRSNEPTGHCHLNGAAEKLVAALRVKVLNVFAAPLDLLACVLSKRIGTIESLPHSNEFAIWLIMALNTACVGL